MNTFKSYPSKNVTTSGATVYTVPFNTQAIGVGLIVANTSRTPYEANVYVTRESVDFYIVANATIPVGGSLVVAGLEQKLALETDDAIKVRPSANSACDVFLSVLEVVPT
jgi:hypothetical protein